MHPIIVPTYNGLELVKRAVDSFKNQTIDTHVMAFDNGSTDGTFEWLQDNADEIVQYFTNTGVTKPWNRGLSTVFERGLDYALVCNADVELPRDFYWRLIAFNDGFITGISITDREALQKPISPNANHSPDFSAFLIRKWVWDIVGPFDERMKIYASDCDYHVRAHRKDIKLWGSNVPFYHERSSTLRIVDPITRRQIQLQADADRAVFKSLYGVEPWEDGYGKLFEPCEFA